MGTGQLLNLSDGSGAIDAGLLVAKSSTVYRESYIPPSVDRYQLNIDSSISIS